MNPQFVEYVSTESPGYQIANTTTTTASLADTSVSLLVFLNILALEPTQIESAPRVRLNVMLLSQSTAEPPIQLVIQPSAKPTDLQTPGFLTNPDGTTTTFGYTIDQQSVFPIKSLNGFLYFTIPKTRSYFLAGQVAELY